MPPNLARRSADEAFADFFGLPAAALAEPGPHVAPHARLSGWNGAWIFRTERSVVLSVPATQRAEVERRVATLDAGALRGDAAAELVFGERAGLVIGPAFWGALDPADFRPADTREVLALDGQTARIEALLARVEPGAGAAYGIDAGAPGQRGLFREKELVAVAGWRDWGGGVGDPGVLTAPTERGQGLGRRVLSAVLGAALERGDLALYQTLRANRPALRLALRLGFQDYASHLAVRFT